MSSTLLAVENPPGNQNQPPTFVDLLCFLEGRVRALKMSNTGRVLSKYSNQPSRGASSSNSRTSGTSTSRPAARSFHAGIKPEPSRGRHEGALSILLSSMSAVARYFSLNPPSTVGATSVAWAYVSTASGATASRIVAHNDAALCANITTTLCFIQATAKLKPKIHNPSMRHPLEAQEMVRPRPRRLQRPHWRLIREWGTFELCWQLLGFPFAALMVRKLMCECC